jgi:hypothetical protein
MARRSLGVDFTATRDAEAPGEAMFSAPFRRPVSAYRLGAAPAWRFGVTARLVLRPGLALPTPTGYGDAASISRFRGVAWGYRALSVGRASSTSLLHWRAKATNRTYVPPFSASPRRPTSASRIGASPRRPTSASRIGASPRRPTSVSRLGAQPRRPVSAPPPRHPDEFPTIFRVPLPSRAGLGYHLRHACPRARADAGPLPMDSP